MICEKGRRNSFANAELWSSTLSRYSRHLQRFTAASVRTRFLERHMRQEVSGMEKAVFKNLSKTVRLRSYRMFTTCCSDRFGDRALEATTRESHSQSHERSKSLRSTSTTNASIESNTKQGTLSELADRLWNFHECANALTNCLQTRDTTRKTDQSMLEAAKCMFSKLLEETNDDLDRALQPQETNRAQATGNGSRCSRD